MPTVTNPTGFPVPCHGIQRASALGVHGGIILAPGETLDVTAEEAARISAVVFVVSDDEAEAPEEKPSGPVRKIAKRGGQEAEITGGTQPRDEIVVAFSQATVSHTFQNADGTAASGSIKWTLTGTMTNGSITIVPSSITTNLNGSGVLSQALTSNVDSGTTPSDPATLWRVDMEILGADPVTYFITVPTGGSSVDLGTLLPGNQQVG